MYATETENFNSTKFDKMMFMQRYSVIGFLQNSPPVFLQYLQHLIQVTLQQHPFLWVRLQHMQVSGSPLGLESTIWGTIEFTFLTKPNNIRIHFQGVISKWDLYPQLLLKTFYLWFPVLTEVKGVLLKSILRVLPLKVVRHWTPNVSRSIVRLRHFTRNDSTICIMLLSAIDC